MARALVVLLLLGSMDLGFWNWLDKFSNQVQNYVAHTRGEMVGGMPMGQGINANPIKSDSVAQPRHLPGDERMDAADRYTAQNPTMWDGTGQWRMQNNGMTQDKMPEIESFGRHPRWYKR